MMFTMRAMSTYLSAHSLGFFVNSKPSLPHGASHRRVTSPFTLMALLALLCLSAAAPGVHASGGPLVSWGDDSDGQVSGTPTVGTFSAVAAGSGYSVVLRSDGTLVSWG